MRVASKVGNLRSKFGHNKPEGSRIIHYVRDGRADSQTHRQTDGRTKETFIAPFPTVRGLIIVNIHWPDKISNQKLWRKTDQLVLSHLRRGKWNRLGHTLRRSDDSITKLLLQREPHGHIEEGTAKEHLEERAGKRNVANGLQYSWRKMGAAAQDRACGL